MLVPRVPLIISLKTLPVTVLYSILSVPIHITPGFWVTVLSTSFTICFGVGIFVALATVIVFDATVIAPFNVVWSSVELVEPSSINLSLRYSTVPNGV